MKSCRYRFGCVLVALVFVRSAPAQLPDPQVQQPLFSRHIVPLMARLGCNSGACHGAVQGQNGFRLSLFGVDPAQDRDHLLRDVGGRRLDPGSPENSLFLLKAAGKVAHEGGARLSVRGWEYRLFKMWVEQGVPLDDLAKSRVIALDVTPAKSIVRPGEHVMLKVVAAFADGSREDVTSFCTFEAQDRDVLKTEDTGKVTAIQPGLSAVVLRFGAEPAVAMVTVPSADASPLPEIKGHNFIDEAVLAQLRRLNIPMSELCDDATFLRRAYLDIAGTLPTPSEVRDYHADKSPDKRAKLIDRLLDHPGHSALWAVKFCDLLKISGYNPNNGFNEAAETKRVYDWLRERLKANVPYDQLVESILAATSRDGRTQDEWLEEVKRLSAENGLNRPGLSEYASRKTLDLYWSRQEATGIKGTLQVAHAFLGLRLECAQCHRHPHDIWKQDDLLSFANFFLRVRGAGGGANNSKLLNGKNADWLKKAPEEAKKLREQAKKLQDKLKQLTKDKGAGSDEAEKCKEEIALLEAKARSFENVPRRFGAEAYNLPGKSGGASVSSPLGTQKSDKYRLLGQTQPLKIADDEDPRRVVVEWLRRPDNPYFARAIVNRVWAHYFTRGIVDPPDHLSPLNPPSHPELLDALAQAFVAKGYDLKWLHRTIASSRTYQTSSVPNDRNKSDRRNFAYYYLRRPITEVLIDAINHATGGVEKYPPRLFLPDGTRALEIPGPVRVPNEQEYASLAFAYQALSRPARNPQTLCDCERETNPTMIAALYLANHPKVHEKIVAPTGRAAEIMKQQTSEEAQVEEMFLWALSRFPTDAERQAIRKHMEGSPSKLLAMQDLLWTLINTKEFLLTR
jgi:hypothetical protein